MARGDRRAAAVGGRNRTWTEDVRLGSGGPGRRVAGRELQRREDRLAAIRAAKARLEAAQRSADDARGRACRGRLGTRREAGRTSGAYGEPEEKAQSNFTDPESGIMKTGNEASSSATTRQAAVDRGAPVGRLATGSDGERERSRAGSLVLLDQVEERFDTQPETVLADAGYCNERDLAELETRGVDALCGDEPGGQAGRRRQSEEAAGDGPGFVQPAPGARFGARPAFKVGGCLPRCRHGGSGTCVPGGRRLPSYCSVSGNLAPHCETSRLGSETTCSFRA